MGQVIPSQPPQDFVSNADNDYNPFNVPSIRLEDSSEMNLGVGITGNPPMHIYNKSTFAKLTLEQKAAYNRSYNVSKLKLRNI